MHSSFLQWQELSGNTQYAGVQLKKSGSGSGHATTWALATLLLVLCELQYLLQCKVNSMQTWFTNN
jgi:hypothetical protein